MKRLPFTFLTLLLLSGANLGIAQNADSTVSDNLKWKQYLVPSVLISYGVTSTYNKKFHVVNKDFKQTFCSNRFYNRTHLDDYLQYAPVVAVFGLNIAGVKGESNFRELTAKYILSSVILTAIVLPAKKMCHQQRPDQSAYNSFPSGHTAAAFAGAELLFQEYKSRSPWYGVAGYLCAAATGYLRVYNNRHTLSDVVAGAGIGIVSTKLANFTCGKLKKTMFKNKQLNTVLY